jgi:hypothetical protein
MKRAILLGACLTLLMSTAAMAQRRPIQNPIRPGIRTSGVVNVSGAVRGRPSGRSFMLASGRGTFTVDASHAVVRFRGRFFPIANLTSGSFVVVHGMLNGTMLVANSVDITRLSGILMMPQRGARTPVRNTIRPPKKGGGKHK